ncbi:hypothetical protein Glove_242g85 [Diversispora epigaea]|uniref:GDP-fucose protein O-fucosyltransferase 2 n=1 Tax=Diversispora epigaea TaxID=1348612 RepID=A0A397IC18_9GLOM|nr:hypothetical protein Glove_242g85 [Diversispora epigaea]
MTKQLINYGKYYKRRCKYSLNFKKILIFILLGYLILKTYIGLLHYENGLRPSKTRLKTVLNPNLISELNSDWLNEDLKFDLEKNDLETDNFDNADAMINLEVDLILNNSETRNDLQKVDLQNDDLQNDDLQNDDLDDILTDDLKYDLENDIVTNIENDLKVDPSEIKKTKTFENPDHRINRKYCGSNECKFLFAYCVMEQETRANLHFLTFTQIALKLNRIIVLTNVGDSRIRTCKPFSFDFYYNIEFLRKRFPNLKFITQNDFRLWTKERFQKPNTDHTLISIGPPFTTEILNFSSSYRKNYYKNYCLNKFDLNFDEKTIFKTINVKKSVNMDDIRNFVIKNSQTDVEVLLYGHNLRFSLFDQSSKMEYAPHLLIAAKEVSKSLHPYIAIHWRMETGNNEMMPGCATKLVKRIKALKYKYGIKNTYFATDYPLLGERSQSSTFRNITAFHYKAMGIIKSSPILFKNWTSINIIKYLKNVNALKKFGEKFEQELGKELTGPGIQGIFDKLILLHSDYFIGGPAGCCRTTSSFTNYITNGRKILKEKNKKIKNIYTQW